MLEDLMALNKKIVLWDLTPFNLVRKYQRFKKTTAFKSYAKCVGRRFLLNVYTSVFQTVVRGPQVVLGFCPCGPLRLNISPKKTEK